MGQHLDTRGKWCGYCRVLHFECNFSIERAVCKTPILGLSMWLFGWVCVVFTEGAHGGPRSNVGSCLDFARPTDWLCGGALPLWNDSFCGQHDSVAQNVLYIANRKLHMDWHEVTQACRFHQITQVTIMAMLFTFGGMPLAEVADATFIHTKNAPARPQLHLK